MSDDTCKVRLGEPVPAAWTGLEWYVATTLPPEGCATPHAAGADMERAGGSCWIETGYGGRKVERFRGRDYAARRLLEESGWPVFLLEERTTGRIRGSGGGRGKRGMFDRNFLPGYVFVGGWQAMVWVCSEIVQSKREGRRHPLTGFLDHEGMPQRVCGADMQALFTAHEIGAHVPRDERDALQRRFAIGQAVQLRDGPFAFVPSIVDAYLTGENVRILEQISGREIPITTRLDRLEAIGV